MVKCRGWLPITEQPQKLVVVGRLYSVSQHYVPQFRQSAACLAPGECQLCESNQPVQTVTAIPVQKPENEEVWLLKLLPRQAQLANHLLSVGPDLIGEIIQVERAPGPLKSLAMIRRTGQRRPSNPPPLDNYIRAIGRATYDRIVEALTMQPEIGEA